jgi:hypothetical protein
MIGDGMCRRGRGHGVGGLVFQGAAGLSNLIGGPGSGEAAYVFRGAAGAANFFCLGLHYKATAKQQEALQKPVLFALPIYYERKVEAKPVVLYYLLDTKNDIKK